MLKPALNRFKTKSSKRLHPGLLCVLVLSLVTTIFVINTGAASICELVSFNNAGAATGNGFSAFPSITPDGRYVAFTSNANNLAANDDNGGLDVFVRDRQMGTTTLVSINATGTGTGSGASPDTIGYRVFISADGRYVAFASLATNLTGISDTNNSRDVFVRDLQTCTTQMVSINGAGNGAGTGNGNSSSSYLTGISANGRYVLFDSFANNLTTTPDINAGSDVFMRDLQTNTTTLVSINFAGTAGSGGEGALMTPDGRYILFTSSAGDLVATGDTNQSSDAYVRDLQTNTTMLVSTNSAGVAVGNVSFIFSIDRNHGSITADGRFVCYESSTANITAIPDTNNATDIFQRDLQTGITTLVSVNSAGSAAASLASRTPQASANGRLVSFVSASADLTNISDRNNTNDSFVRDLETGTTSLASINMTGTGSGNFESTHTLITPDGRYVFFIGRADNLTPYTIATPNIFVRDLRAGRTTVVNRSPAGFSSGSCSPIFDVTPDGRRVAFASESTALVSTPDTNNGLDVFVTRFSPNPIGSDFDGDGKTDLAVFRNGNWYISQSSDNLFRATQFGLASDKITPADFDGDGKTDISVFRDGTWYILQSSNNAFLGQQFGQTGDTPVPADYDGDGKSDLAVFRQGSWYILQSSNNGFQAVQFGISTDKVTPGDYDGDGKTDVSVFRGGTWYFLHSSNGAVSGLQFGLLGDLLVQSDYDGDGKTDVGVFRGGNWYVLNSSNNSFSGTAFGLGTDRPSPGDYDGDGKIDIAVFRDGLWYVLQSSDNGFRGYQFGLNGDQPIPSAYVP